MKVGARKDRAPPPSEAPVTDAAADTALDLSAAIVDAVAAPLVAWLADAGVDERPALSPPTVEGPDLAMPCHKYARVFRRSPKMIAEEAAEKALTGALVKKAEAVNGFLNLWLDWTELAPRVVAWAAENPAAVGLGDSLGGKKVVIEYSSPNTNKPQHLGHCRNNLLGQTVGTMLAAAGAEVKRVNLVNDRGIHICKSMVAYDRLGEGATPESTGKKGDHFIGDFYVRFASALSAEYAAAFPDGNGPGKDAFFNEGSDWGAAAKDMLRRWEAGDDEVRALWRKMNGWCEAGFWETYARMGVDFDAIDRESDTYLLGKSLVEKGLEKGVFIKDPKGTGAVVFDQQKLGLEGHKVVLRGDGTSLYITQDLGTAMMRFERDAFDQAVYVVGNEQDHYFRVLFGILAHIEPQLAGRLVHRSYGMVELTTGKMKSREGTVVDADDLMDDLRAMVLAQSTAENRWEGLSAEAQQARAEAIGMAGLKFYLLKFNPERNFVFDKETSIDIRGETGPYCQYAHARVATLLAKVGDSLDGVAPDWSALDNAPSRAVMQALLAVPGQAAQGAQGMDPSALTKAVYELSKAWASFYNNPDCRVLGAPEGTAAARVALARVVQRALAGLLGLLGIEALDEM